MLNLLKVMILGFVEGITEWLPISSTGHMILIDEFLRLDVRPEFLEMFLVVVQLGAILAVVVLFWKQLWPFGARGNLIRKDIFAMWFKVLVACLPAAVVGILWSDTFEALFYNYQTVAVMLILVGILFLVVENYQKGKQPKINSIAQISYPVALWIGFCQLIAAVFPGTSRSGATIVGAMLVGVSRVVAAEFTFFMAVPVMFGASALKLLKFGFDYSPVELAYLLCGMLVAFLVSVLAIKFLLRYIKNHSFVVFGWYRIFLGMAVLLYFILNRA